MRRLKPGQPQRACRLRSSVDAWAASEWSAAVHRDRIIAVDELLPVPRAPTLGECQTSVPTRRVIVIETEPLVDLESSRGESSIELEPRDQRALRGHMSGTCPDERTTTRHRAKQRDVSSHHNDIEDTTKCESGQVGLHPCEFGRHTTSLSDHRGVHVDPDDLDAVTGQLDGNPSRATSCVKDGPRAKRTNKGCLAMDVHSLFGQGVEPGLISPSVEPVHRITQVTDTGYTACVRNCPSDHPAAVPYLCGIAADLRFVDKTSEMERPRTRYVAVGDADVAYQVFGEGPIDLLVCYGLGHHVDLVWEVLGIGDFFTRLASFSRVICFDRRGTGASDGLASNAVPTWEQFTEDMTAVLSAAGSEHPVVMAAGDTGPIGILFSAMHPEMIRGLILLNTAAKYSQADDYPTGSAPEGIDWFLELCSEGWGSEKFALLANPSMANDPEYIRRSALVTRASATPRSAVAQLKYLLRDVDVRSALSLIQSPTLVIHAMNSQILASTHGRYLAEHIPDSMLVELAAGDIGLNPAILYQITDEVSQFLTGVRLDTTIERVLTTVLFSDIVESTQRAASLGDQRWRAVLDSHDTVVRDQLRIFKGREIKTTGDGFMASFDGPARAIRCARAIVDANASIGIAIRAGLHTGECEVRGDDLGGMSVHIAARVGTMASVGEVLVSSTVKDLVVGSGIEFDDRGEHALKGVPGTWRLFAVQG